MRKLKSKIRFQWGTYLLIASVVMGCESPLLNHTKEGDTFLSQALPSSALYFNSAALFFTFKWITPPTVNKLSSLTLYFGDNQDAAVNGPFVDPGKTVDLELWMPDHGHGSSPVEVKKISSGVYQIDEVFFSMKGKWLLRFQLKDSKGKVMEEVPFVLTL